MSKLVDLTEQRFGTLTVTQRAANRKGDTYWQCLCDCGNTLEVRADHLRRGMVRSCGCNKGKLISKAKMKHGMRHTKLYGVWNSMIQRCENPQREGAALYHDRGISVCEDWHDFSCFMDWAMRNGYKEGLTIDRINNNGNYYPENCRWADLITQANNKRTNVRIEYKGIIQTIAQWAHEIGMDHRALWQRLKRGWSVERAIETPL